MNQKTEISRTISLDWLGQTIASACWILSAFAYGVNSTGDWLQLLAATSWLFANISNFKKLNN